MPGIMRPKQPRENKLRAFVVFMFFVIVLMISLTYVYHQQHLLKMMQLAVGERIKFGENNRVIQLSNAAKQGVLTGRLGTALATDDLPRNCHVDSQESINETACLEWNHLAKMKVVRRLVSDAAKCYQVQWESLQDGMILQDCFSLSYANWYGMGEFNPQLWPMNDLEEYIRTNDTAFITGNISRDVFGTILEGYWLSSNGVAIVADLSAPLYINLDRGITGHLCLLSKPTAHNTLSTLKYTLCTSWDIQQVHRHIMEKTRTSSKTPLPKDWKIAVESIVWSTHQRFGNLINDTILNNFTEEIYNLQLDGSAGILIVDSQWQGIDGDFTFDTTLFSDPKELIGTLTNRGFRVVLNVLPYISTASENYYKHLDKNYWVRDITGQVPNLVRWEGLKSAVLVDFTNPQAQRWYQSTLEELRLKYRIHSFQFHGGETTSLPPYANFQNPLPNRNNFAQLYSRAGSKSGLAFSVDVASQFQSFSSFVEISPRQSTWIPPYGLRSVIPAALSAGLVGYPFFLAGPVGGSTTSGRPNRELYIRWLQLAAFFPVLQMSVLPSDYDNEVVTIAEKIFQLRKTIVIPVLKTAIAEAETTGIPIIRPLWWIAPNDTDAQSVDTEFLVGNDLLVAPIIAPHDDQRDIYLPPGLWADWENGQHKGGKWLYDYRSSLSKVAYFKRISDSGRGARFY